MRKRPFLPESDSTETILRLDPDEMEIVLHSERCEYCGHLDVFHSEICCKISRCACDGYENSNFWPFSKPSPFHFRMPLQIAKQFKSNSYLRYKRRAIALRKFADTLTFDALEIFIDWDEAAFVRHIESHFMGAYEWNNYDLIWEVDHKFPVGQMCAFQPTDSDFSKYWRWRT